MGVWLSVAPPDSLPWAFGFPCFYTHGGFCETQKFVRVIKVELS